MVDKSVIDTMIAEAGGSEAGLRAVAAVINNRSGQWGLTPSEVVKQAGQFEGYSNPGHASKAAQKDASVRAKAERAWNDITSGRVADPTYGGVSFRASYASSGMSAPHGTVTIGGNTFAKGSGSPQTALAAINAVSPPSPQQRPPALAYAPAESIPSVPRPSMQLPADAMYGVGRLSPGQRAVLPTDFATDTGPAATSLMSLIAPKVSAAPALTSHSVHTVPIDPMTGNPVSASQPQQRDLQSALNDYAARLGASRTTGGFKTANPQAGDVQLPAGVVPASAQRDMGFLSMLSGQPIAGGATSAPFAPSPGIASGANFATASATPYIPGPRGATSAYKDVAQLPASNTVFDTTPAYTEKTVMVPKQVAIPSLPNPSSAILGGLSIANGALPPQYKTVMVPKTVRVPTVPTPQPPSFPTMVGNGLMNIFNHSAPGHVAQLLTGKPVTGGFLSLLQGNPIQAARLVSNGVLSSPPPVSQPGFNGTNTVTSNELAGANQGFGGVNAVMPDSMNTKRWLTGY
jgi:hypothetical protein